MEKFIADLSRVLEITERYEIEVRIRIGKCVMKVDSGKISFSKNEAKWLQEFIKRPDMVINDLNDKAKRKAFDKIREEKLYDQNIVEEDCVGEDVRLRSFSDYFLMAGKVGKIKSYHDGMYEFYNGYDSTKIVAREEFEVL